MPQVTAAVRLAMRTCRFFPKPVELRELMTGRADERADLAWGELLREVRRVGYLGTPMFTDASMLPTIHTVFGGWRHLCETLPAGGPELVGWIKQFKSAYGTVRSATATGCPDLLVGIRGVTHLVEVKDGAKPPSRRTFTPEQRRWIARWQGSPVVVLTDDATAREWVRKQRSSSAPRGEALTGE